MNTNSVKNLDIFPVFGFFYLLTESFVEYLHRFNFTISNKLNVFVCFNTNAGCIIFLLEQSNVVAK